MVEWINSWTQGIMVAAIVSAMIEMILPDGNIKKYIRTVIGTYIVFVIVAPIITKITGNEIDFSKYKLPENKNVKQVSIDTNQYIQSTYINKIKEEILNDVNEKGYEVDDIDVCIETSEKYFGKITQIYLKLRKNQKKEINEIKPIEIKLEETESIKEKISEDEIIEIKNSLIVKYGIEVKNITIEK